MSLPVWGGKEIRLEIETLSRKCEVGARVLKAATYQWRTLEKTIIANVLKNDSAVVAAEDVMRERINIESTNKFKITEW